MAGASVLRFLVFDSAITAVWECIVDDGVRTVVFYCTPTIKDSTLKTEMNRSLNNLPRGFDTVIWTSVSRNSDVGTIQDEIGGQIGLKNESWEGKTVDEKAADIHRKLSNKRFVLVVYNLLQMVESLKEVGIPEPSHQNGSKLVFVTRSLDVSRQMEAQEETTVVLLTSMYDKLIGNGMGGGSSEESQPLLNQDHTVLEIEVDRNENDSGGESQSLPNSSRHSSNVEDNGNKGGLIRKVRTGCLRLP